MALPLSTEQNEPQKPELFFKLALCRTGEKTLYEEKKTE